MSRPTPDEVRGVITAFFSAPSALPDAFDVIVDGGLDSLGFLELLSLLEQTFEQEVDLEAAPDGELTSVGTLVAACSSPPLSV